MRVFHSAFFLFSVVVSSASFAAPAKISDCEFTMPAANDLAGAKAIVSKLKSQCIPKIGRVHACTVRTRLLLENVNDLSKIFLTSNKSKPLMVDAAQKGPFDPQAVDMSLWANFQALEKDYQASLDSVNAFVDRFREKTDDKVKLLDLVAELDRGYALNGNTLAELSLRESALLYYLDEATSALEKSAESTRPEVAWLASEACKDADLKPSLAGAKAAIEKIVQRISSIRSMVVRAREAREHLLQYSYAAMRQDLVLRHQDQAMQELATLGGKLDTVLHVNRVSVNFDLWINSLLRNNERDKIETIYLQFEASQRNNAIDFETAKGFKEQVLLASENYPEAATPYLIRMDNIIDDYKRRLEAIEKKGWQGFLERQKIMTAKRLGIADRYPAACVANLQAFQDSIPSIMTIEQYRVGEVQFMDAVKSCEVKQ
jgi:hypothetical protein